MFLANIQHETTISTYNRTMPVKGNQYAIVAPPLYIDLFVVCSSPTSITRITRKDWE